MRVVVWARGRAYLDGASRSWACRTRTSRSSSRCPSCRRRPTTWRALRPSWRSSRAVRAPSSAGPRVHPCGSLLHAVENLAESYAWGACAGHALSASAHHHAADVCRIYTHGTMSLNDGCGPRHRHLWQRLVPWTLPTGETPRRLLAHELRYELNGMGQGVRYSKKII